MMKSPGLLILVGFKELVTGFHNGEILEYIESSMLKFFSPKEMINCEQHVTINKQ